MGVPTVFYPYDEKITTGVSADCCEPQPEARNLSRSGKAAHPETGFRIHGRHDLPRFAILVG